MTSETKTRPRYDIPTAVTFLIYGLGIGSVLTMLLSLRTPHQTVLPFPASRRVS